MGRSLKISTQNIYPPIPIRTQDWVATWGDYYDGAPDSPSHPMGFGETEFEAIADLIENTEPDYLADVVKLDESEAA